MEQTIVEAVGAIALSNPSRPGSKAMAAAIERAMSDAVIECSAAGVTDPDKVRLRMLHARDRVKEAMLVRPA